MKRIALIGLAALLAAPVLAQPATVTRERADVKVDDLDLTTPAGRASADKRLSQDVSIGCDQQDRGLRAKTTEGNCQRSLMTRGRARIADAAAQKEAARLTEIRRLSQVQIRHRIPKERVRTVVVYRNAPHRAGHRKVVHRRVVHKRTTVHHTSR